MTVLNSPYISDVRCKEHLGGEVPSMYPNVQGTTLQAREVTISSVPFKQIFHRDLSWRDSIVILTLYTSINRRPIAVLVTLIPID